MHKLVLMRSVGFVKSPPTLCELSVGIQILLVSVEAVSSFIILIFAIATFDPWI